MSLGEAAKCSCEEPAANSDLQGMSLDYTIFPMSNMYKRTLHSLIDAGLSAEPVNRLLRRRVLTGTIVALMYHEVADDDADFEAWTVVRVSDFCRQIENLRRDFDIVSLPEALARSERWDISERPLAVITFDDGDKGNAELLMPLLQSLGLPVTIFVSTRHILEQTGYWFDRVVNVLQTQEEISLNLTVHGLQKYNINRIRGPENWNEIQRLLEDLKTLEPEKRERTVSTLLEEMQDLNRRKNCQIAPLSIENVRDLATSPYVTIGAHSHCHNILTQIGESQAAHSVLTSKSLLQQWTGKEIQDFAYPNGNCNDALVEILSNAGFRSGMTTESRPWNRGDSRFRIPRIGIGRYDSLDRFRVKLVRGIHGLKTWNTAA